MSNRLIELELFHLHIPFRHEFSHAKAKRVGTDTVVLVARLANGVVGYGQCVPRDYVTGETVESVNIAITDTFGEYLGRVEPKSFSAVLELIDALPFRDRGGRIVNSARCCIELALLDAYGKHFGCGMEGLTEWLGYGGFAGKATSEKIRVSGVLSGTTPAKVSRLLKMMWWYGLRDFKLKLGCEHDEETLDIVSEKLFKAIKNGKATLRVDANGAWDVETAAEKSYELANAGVCCLEQPLITSDLKEWKRLARATALPLMADELLLTAEDGLAMAEEKLVDFFNIRISKNGGLLASMRLAALADKWSLGYQLGAMVGETGILAGAGRQFLQLVPGVEFTEICYGEFLLAKDIVKPKLRFGFGGKMRQLSGSGLGISVNEKKMRDFLVGQSRKIKLA